VTDGFRKAVREIVGVPSLTRNVDELGSKLATLSGEVGELQRELRGFTGQVERLPSELAALARQVGELKEESTASRQQVMELQKTQSGRALQEAAEKKMIQDLSDEISRCRALSEGTIFVLGFGRSSTTISTEILNSSKDVFMLAEANFYMPHRYQRFRDWYNQMHFEFNNQVSKSTYAPDFVPEISHGWLDWLSAANELYPFVGDKMAFSDKHFSIADPHKIQSFFEARFFKSKYVFTIRDPIQTLLSTAKLFNISSDRGMIAEMIAWLRFVKMWADWVRIFPNTMSFEADKLGKGTIGDLQAFIGIELSNAEIFIDERNRTNHLTLNAFPILHQFKGALTAVFELVKAAMSNHPSQWQLLGEKRGGRPSNSEDTKIHPAHLSKTPIFSAWAMCEKLIGQLEAQLGSA
jgi:Sulfotransferase family